MIPELRDDGYLPEGVHLSELEEIVARFGNTPRRSRLIARIRIWVGLARSIGARRLLLAGSFVSAKPEPTDVDAVILLPESFANQLDRGLQDALELAEMLTTRYP